MLPSIPSNVIKIGVGLIGIVLASRLFGGDNFISNQIDPSKPSPVITEADALARANAIDAALRGAGTDEQVVYDSFIGNLGANDYALIQQQFGSRGGRDLTRSLTADLSGDEFNWVRWLVGKESNGNIDLGVIDSHANTIHDAVDGLGTDEIRIFEVLSPYHVLDVDQLSNLYSARFNQDLKTRLRSELSDRLYNMLRRKFPNRF